MTTLELGPGERVPGKPFADPEETARDLEVLATIRGAQRARIAAEGVGGTWVDTNGSSHWLVAPRPELLRGEHPCLAVGFFGQARPDVDHGIIIQLEHAMLERASRIPGLLAYHNVQLASGQWGNLVLFRDGTDTAPMRADPDHADAIARAPAHYHSLRLHRGSLPDGPAGRRGLALSTTLYLDFADVPAWRAIRAAAWDEPESASEPWGHGGARP